jgi:predicted RNase H-related nuclease YkuK (DUF458 family)
MKQRKEILHMQSLTHGQVSLKDMAKIIYETVSANEYNTYRLIIGTDSQNTDVTTTVAVIVLVNEGKGGKFFYEKIKTRKIKNLREKLHFETQTSLDYAGKLINEFEKLYDKYGFDYTVLNMSIHVDAGKNGPTKALIAEISGWVQSLGYVCQFKPNSYVASTVADRLSK